MKRLLTLGPQEIQSGIWKTSKASGLLWEEGNNVLFRDQGFRRIDGALDVGTAMSSKARDIAQAYVAGTRRVYIGGDTHVDLFEFAGGVWSKTGLLVWPTAGQYADLETWGTWLVGTNNADPVKVWKNTGAMGSLAGTPFTRAKVLKRKQPFLLAFNTNNIGDTAVEWSSDSNIEDWTPTLSNKAGNFNLRDLESEILAAEDLGDRVAVYSRSSMSLGTFTGGQSVWSWKRAVKGIGAVSRRSVVTLDPFNYGIMRDGIFKTDGNSFAFVDDPQMLKYIRDTADFSKEAQFWGFADAVSKSVTFNFMDSNSEWHQVSYYPESGIFTKGDLQITAGAPKEVLNFPLVASDGFRLGTWQESQTFFGAGIAYNLKSKPLDFGDRTYNKLLQLVRVDGQWSAGNIRVCSVEHPEDPSPKIIIDRPLEKENYFERDAQYFTVEFYGTLSMYVTGIEFFGEPTGIAL